MYNITEKQQLTIKKWIDDLTVDSVFTGAIGGRFTYLFTPTSFGTILVVRDSVTKKELDVTDYGSW